MASNKSKVYLIWAEFKYLIFKEKYMVLIDATDKCNLRCRYCYHKEHLSPKDETTVGEWEERFKKCYKMGIRYATFIGGEPSLRYDVLQVAENYFPFIDTYTNGQIKIPQEFNHRILLSLEGLETEHDEIYGRGTFKRAVSNYLGDKRVVIYTVLSVANYKGEKKLKEFIDFVKRINVRGVRFTPYLPSKKEDNSLVLTQQQRQEIGQTLLEELKKNNSIILMTEDMINYLASTSLPAKKCENIRMRFFDAQGREKHCVDSELDCSRCIIAQFKKNPPLYKLKEWVFHKWNFYKSLPEN